MRLPLFIANRYLLAKKSHNLINIITWISILGISVGSFALIVVLSAFNGLEKVISSMNNRLTPDLQIATVKGKTIDLTAFPLGQLEDIQGVDYVIPTITEDALFRANDKQHIGQVRKKLFSVVVIWFFQMRMNIISLFPAQVWRGILVLMPTTHTQWCAFMCPSVAMPR